jgi:hypothetical protein
MKLHSPAERSLWRRAYLTYCKNKPPEAAATNADAAVEEYRKRIPTPAERKDRLKRQRASRKAASARSRSRR